MGAMLVVWSKKKSSILAGIREPQQCWRWHWGEETWKPNPSVLNTASEPFTFSLREAVVTQKSSYSNAAGSSVSGSGFKPATCAEKSWSKIESQSTIKCLSDFRRWNDTRHWTHITNVFISFKKNIDSIGEINTAAILWSDYFEQVVLKVWGVSPIWCQRISGRL